MDLYAPTINILVTYGALQVFILYCIVLYMRSMYDLRYAISKPNTVVYIIIGADAVAFTDSDSLLLKS